MKHITLKYLGIDAPDYFRGFNGNLLQVAIDKHSTCGYVKSEMLSELHDFYHENGEEFTNEEYLDVENQIRGFWRVNDQGGPDVLFCPTLEYSFDDVGGDDHFMYAYFGVVVREMDSPKLGEDKVVVVNESRSRASA